MAKVYPPEVFERRRLYNVAVSRSRHPGLNAYVKETIFSLKPWIKQGKLERLAVLFFEEEGDALVERLVFSVKVLKEVEGELRYLLTRARPVEPPTPLSLLRSCSSSHATTFGPIHGMN